jgi:hypothetical protein
MQAVVTVFSKMTPELLDDDLPVRSRYSVLPTADQWDRMEEFKHNSEEYYEEHTLDEGKYRSCGNAAAFTHLRLRTCVYAGAFLLIQGFYCR